MADQVYELDNSLRRLGGDRDLFCDLIRFFLEDSPKLLDQLRSALVKQDGKSATHASHTLKGLAANFTARRAVDAADRVERLAAHKAFSDAEQAAVELQQRIEELRSALVGFVETLRASGGG
jgi:two-component system, sensor histidine kinase and response regulator